MATVDGTSPPRPFPARTLAAASVITLVIVAIFYPVMNFEFVDWDDWLLVGENPRLNPPTVHALGEFWNPVQPGLYTPVTFTTYAGLIKLTRQTPGKLHPGVFHAVNLMVHIVAAVLAMLLIRRLFYSDLAATVGALIFAVHPVQVESVAWIASFNSVLSGAFGVGALLLYVLHAQHAKEAKPSVALFLAATVLAVLAMLAKPSAVVLPPLAVVLDCLVVGRSWRKVWKPLSVWLVAAIAVGVINRIVQPPILLKPSPLWSRPLIALDALAFYVGQIVWPARLGVDYGRTPQWLLQSSQIVWTWVVPVLLFAAAWKRRRSQPWLLASAAFIGLSLIPVLGLVAGEFQVYSTVADRYLYVTLIGVSFLAAAAIQRYRIVATVALTLFLVALGIRAAVQVRTWRDSQVLAEHTIKVSPKSPAGPKILGSWLVRNQRDAEAIEHFRKVLVIHRDDDVQYNLASALLRLKRFDEAAELLVALEKTTPNNLEVVNSLGFAYIQLGKFDEAGEQFNKAVKLGPTDPRSWTNFGSWLAMQNRPYEAQDAFETALKIDPEFVGARHGLEMLRQQPRR